MLEEYSFSIVEVLTDCTKQENKVPKFLPYFVGTGKILRASRANTFFVHNFVDLYVWKHMSNGKYWMTKSDLDPMKNLNNVEQLKVYANYLCENYGHL